jgi:hypothetical protein
MADTPDPTGTTLQGYLFAYYRALVAAFGEPKPTADGKTDARWIIDTPYGVATISNRTDLPAAEAISWAIGAHSMRPGIWVNNQLPDPYGPDGPYWPKEDKLRAALLELAGAFEREAASTPGDAGYSDGFADAYTAAATRLRATLGAVS